MLKTLEHDRLGQRGRKVKHRTLIDSQEFSTWFNQSRVIDENTGTPLIVYHGTNSDFSEFELTEGIELFGAFFSECPDEAHEWAELKGDNTLIMPVYLRIENPADYGDVCDAIDRISRRGIRDPSPTQVTNSLRRAGFDGYIDDRGGSNELVVFSPTQIKSALGNPGSFYRSNPSITDGQELRMRSYLSSDSVNDLDEGRTISRNARRRRL